MKQHSMFNEAYAKKLIFSTRLCDFLMEKGHKLIDYEQNKNGKGLVFIFNNSNQLHFDIDEYLDLKKQYLSTL